VTQGGRAPSQPLYWRLLRLRHVQPSSWQRAVFFEGSLAVATILVLADLASAWLLVVLPVAVAVVVKGHDVLVGWLPAPADRARVVAGEPTVSPEVVAEVGEEPTVRIVAAPKPRQARSRPGAAAARAQASKAGTLKPQPVTSAKAQPVKAKTAKTQPMTAKPETAQAAKTQLAKAQTPTRPRAKRPG
jgi:hypothetical protein